MRRRVVYMLSGNINPRTRTIRMGCFVDDEEAALNDRTKRMTFLNNITLHYRDTRDIRQGKVKPIKRTHLSKV